MGMRNVCYPALHVVLHGVLSCPDFILPSVTDVFAHAEFMTLEDGLVLSSDDICALLSKEIAVQTEIALHGSVSKTASVTSLDPVEIRLPLGASADLTVQKPVETQGGIKLAADTKVSVSKSVGDAIDGLRLSCEISDMIVITNQRITVTVLLDGGMADAHLIKDAGELFSPIFISADVLPASVQSIEDKSESLILDASLEVEAVRLRRLDDLDGLTLGDLDIWTLNEFYYKEE